MTIPSALVTSPAVPSITAPQLTALAPTLGPGQGLTIGPGSGLTIVELVAAGWAGVPGAVARLRLDRAGHVVLLECWASADPNLGATAWRPSGSTPDTVPTGPLTVVDFSGGQGSTPTATGGGAAPSPRRAGDIAGPATLLVGLVLMRFLLK